MKPKHILLTIAISAFISFAMVFTYGHLMESRVAPQATAAPMPIKTIGYHDGESNGGPVDFTQAASSAAPAVVHVKTHVAGRMIKNTLPEDDPFAQFFGQRQQTIPEQRGSGSGVILSQDGYIVTNQHVIEGADKITVTLANGRVYQASLVGADEKTDLAVLKINAANLPFLLYGNSNDIKAGQWVLAIGYPWNLDLTVTAGIISAKTRSVGIDKADHPDQPFIQTDAAINLGNSGGALINTAGQLIGINAALASPTGTYAGYSYAIPVNIVRKTVDDLIKFGSVKSTNG
jgi:S1-C subfamily serine protease